MKKIVKALAVTLAISLTTLSLTACEQEIPQTYQLSQSSYTTVFFDDFNGDKLDDTKWKINTMIDDTNSAKSGTSSGGYYTKDAVSVSDGMLHIKTEYLKGTPDNLGSGWYTGWVESSKNINTKYQTNDNYSGATFKYGYFEIRCKCPPTNSIWSSFTLMPDSANLKPTNQILEINVMESLFRAKRKSLNQPTIHYLDKNGNRASDVAETFKVQDMYSTFHTYGLEWTPDLLSFYIDGYKIYETPVKDAKGNIIGVPDISQYLVLSVEVCGYTDDYGNVHPGYLNEKEKSKLGNPMKNDLYFENGYDFAVDYVKVMQRI